MFRLLALAVLCCAASFITAADQPKEINFGIISTESSANLKPLWQPFLADMEKALNVKVNPFYATDYAGVIEAMKVGKVDLAWFGNKSAMEAVDRAGAEVFVQTVDKDGNPGYWSLILVHKDSPIQSLDQLLANGSQYTFSIGDPNSTSGFLVPLSFVFAPRGVDPKTHFKRLTSGNHESNALAVASKQVDAATCNTESLRRLEITKPEMAKDLREIWRSPLIPSDPICWRKSLPEVFKAKTKAWFLAYGKTPDEEKVLTALQWKPFKESGDYQLLPVRKLELIKNRAKIENDEKIPAGEKQARIQEIAAKLEMVEKQIAEHDAKSH